MALRQKRFSEIEVVLKIDEALNMNEEEYQAYIDSGFQKDKIKLVEGQEPTWFKIQPLTKRQKMQIDLSGSTPMSLNSKIVKYGLKGVKNYLLEEEDGAEVELEEPKFSNGPNGQELADSWIARANMLLEVEAEIANCIWSISEAKGFLSTP